jgi:hypothetical protein
VSQPKFEPRASRIQVQTVTAAPTCSVIQHSRLKFMAEEGDGVGGEEEEKEEQRSRRRKVR